MGKKKQRSGHISEAILPTDFILGTKVQPNKTHSMTQVPQIFPKMCKNKRTGHIQEAISPNTVTCLC